MMIEQRRNQLQKNNEERLHIGGEIQVIHLTNNGFNVFCLHKFDDYDNVEEAIFNNINNKS